MTYLFKRILLPFLSAVLCGTVMGICAGAEETAEIPVEEIPVTEQEEIICFELPGASAVNPFYEAILSEEDFVTAPSLDADGTSDPAFADYLSYDEAYSYMREMMNARQETITIYLHLKNPSYEEYYYIAGNFFYDAMEHTGMPKEGDTLFWQWIGFGCSNPSISYTGTDYYCKLPYTVTYYTTAEQEAAVDTAVAALKAEIFTDDMNDFETVKAAYDWICENVRYDYTNLNNSAYKLKFSAYAALIDRTAVCQGYALLMYRLMMEQGIDCRVIPGLGNGGAHAWNIVELDGVYYNLDATWDEGVSPETYGWFLLNEESFVNHERANPDIEEFGERYHHFSSEEFYEEYPMSETNYFTDEDIRTGGILDEASGVRWDLTYGGTLTISGEGAMPDFNQGGSVSTEYLPWGAVYNTIKEIIIEPGITSLGIGAFFYSENAVSVDIADTVTKIDQLAFTNCSSLTEIKIPANVTSIGYQAFTNCSSLAEIRFLGDAPTINSTAFTNVNAAAYYPAGNATWTSAELQNYGGTIAWQSLSDRTGDADGDGSITLSDAVYLLRFTILPDRYPTAENADYNNDNSVDIFDVLRLLNHIGDPDNYPIC